MDREYYQDLAVAGLRMPIGVDLLLREQPDPDAVLLDGGRLGSVLEQTARRFRTPLALSLMDLTLEKTAMLGRLGIPADQAGRYHFDQPPTEEQMDLAGRPWTGDPHPRYRAVGEAIRYVAARDDLVPLGMVIGPFSLMTKLLADPIVPVFMAGKGIAAAENPRVLAVERCLEMAIRFILCSVEMQVRAGAKAVCVAEPAANLFYISPRQLDAGSDIYERYVMRPNRRLKARLDDLGADLFFHCCGELTPGMLRHFTELDPAVLSLGSSRRLWEDAAIVPERTVLFGNLPSKRFYSDHEMSREQVAEAARELIARMRAVRRPFILGTECDVLDVEGCHDVIMGKVEAFLTG